MILAETTNANAFARLRGYSNILLRGQHIHPNPQLGPRSEESSIQIAKDFDDLVYLHILD